MMYICAAGEFPLGSMSGCGCCVLKHRVHRQSNMGVPASYIFENESVIAAAIALNASLRLLQLEGGIQR